MAKTGAVWGIDIGQCALKALRCSANEDDKKITVEAFDYIEYPKILSQPDANPVELVRDAIQLFLSRNSVKGDRVAISVSGQAGLARFIKLPPVESKKIPDIVKYEARQQIPFALEEVIWDYQTMIGGEVQEGFALETEVGLFAMKRDQVYKALKPFDDAKIEVDVIQLTPLALYNFVAFDQLQNVPPPEEIDPENPPESLLLLSLGTDTADLVVTNGYKIWQRSVPLGGSHFTLALTKELKLTFAKAEHLKRNATKSEDPKAVFQAMRPVFNNLVTEIERSVRFFSGIDKTATIGGVLALGNAMKLPGLQKYLSQNLGLPVHDLTAYRGLSGAATVKSPAFKDNMLAFGVCYGLCLQGLGKSRLRTNLIPREILQDRLIRDKKPWAVVALAAVMIGCLLGYFGSWRVWHTNNEQNYTAQFSQSATIMGNIDTEKKNFEEAQKTHESISATYVRLRNIEERGVLWPEVLAAIGSALPKQEKPEPIIELRNEIHCDSLDCERVPDLQAWFAQVKSSWAETHPGVLSASAATPPAAAPAAPEGQKPQAGAAAPTPADSSAAPAAGSAAAAGGGAEIGPKGEGWVIEIRAHHYHNSEKSRPATNAEFVRRTLIDQLENGSVTINGKETKIKDLGIGYPVLLPSEAPKPVEIAGPADAAADGKDEPKREKASRLDFVVQFCWQERPASVRSPASKPAPPAVQVTAPTAPATPPAGQATAGGAGQ